MAYWIVSSKHSRDEGTKGWDSKWTTDSFLRRKRFYPSVRQTEFQDGDRCLLKEFGSQKFVADFRLAGPGQKDKEGDTWYPNDEIYEWDYPVHQHNLPVKYTSQLSRSSSTWISEQDFHELIGIRHYTQNLRLNYRNRLRLHISEHDVESLIDSKNALKSRGFEIIDRQLELTPGNILDLLCKDAHGDLVVVELKKGGANKTIGQLARYVTDVRTHRAKPGQNMSGMILALEVDEQLIKAARGVGFDVVLCQLTFG